MRALSLFLAATTLLTAMNMAQAGDGSIEARRATAEQMEQVTGSYKLSDGRSAEIVALGTRLYVQIGHGQRKELLMAGADRFISRDGRLAVQFGSDLGTERIVLQQDGGAIPQETIRLASAERAGRGGAE